MEERVRWLGVEPPQPGKPPDPARRDDDPDEAPETPPDEPPPEPVQDPPPDGEPRAPYIA